MPDPIYRITAAGAPAVIGPYWFTALHNSRPYYTNPATGIMIWWGTSTYSRWLIGTHLQWYSTTNYYWGWPMWADWYAELLQSPWGLGEHPDAAMPLPSIEMWAPPLGPTASNLLVEGVLAPTRVADPTPDITWHYHPGDCPGDQAAYRILAATAPELLEPGHPDLWDSGIHETNATAAIYAGQPLGDNEMVFYRVMVRDNDGVWSP